MTLRLSRNRWTIRHAGGISEGLNSGSRSTLRRGTRKRHDEVPAARFHLVEWSDDWHAFRTWRFGKRVGEDEFGNVYYEGGMSSYGLPKRWVIYNGYAEASAIPPGWHGWMHHRTDVPPTEENYVAKEWQKAASPKSYRHAAGLPPAGFARRCRRTSARHRRLRRLDAGQLIPLDKAGRVRPGFWPQLTFTRRFGALKPRPSI